MRARFLLRVADLHIDKPPLVVKQQMVSTCEIKAHLGFLRAVHVASGPGEKSLYADGARLRTAVRTYCAWLASEGRLLLFNFIRPVHFQTPQYLCHLCRWRGSQCDYFSLQNRGLGPRRSDIGRL